MWLWLAWNWLHGPSWPWTVAVHLPRAEIKGTLILILCLYLSAGSVGLQVCTIILSLSHRSDQN